MELFFLIFIVVLLLSFYFDFIFECNGKRIPFVEIILRVIFSAIIANIIISIIAK